MRKLFPPGPSSSLLLLDLQTESGGDTRDEMCCWPSWFRLRERKSFQIMMGFPLNPFLSYCLSFLSLMERPCFGKLSIRFPLRLHDCKLENSSFLLSLLLPAQPNSGRVLFLKKHENKGRSSKKTERERFFLGRCRLLRRHCMETTLKGTKKSPPPSFFDVKARDPPSPLFSAARERAGDIYFPPPPPLFSPSVALCGKSEVRTRRSLFLFMHLVLLRLPRPNVLFPSSRCCCVFGWCGVLPSPRLVG